MKKILVPLDFSEYSLEALDVATYIAGVKEAKIRILHAVEDSYIPYYNMTGMGMVEDNSLFTYRKELEENLKIQLSEIADKIRKKNIEVETEIIEGSPKKIIIDELEKNDIDLIVMGSHGHNDIEEIFIGSTSEKVIRTASVPVLTVHESAENYKIDKIVFASNFEEPEIESVLERVIDFAELFMAELFLVRINTPSKLFSSSSGRKRIDELANKFNLSAGAVTSFSDRNEEEGIVNYAKEIQADLITLCTHGRTGLARLFKGSIAEEVAGFSNIPVLTFNIAKDKIIRTGQPLAKERKLKIDHSKRKVGKSK